MTPPEEPIVMRNKTSTPSRDLQVARSSSQQSGETGKARQASSYGTFYLRTPQLGSRDLEELRKGLFSWSPLERSRAFPCAGELYSLGRQSGRSYPLSVSVSEEIQLSSQLPGVAGSQPKMATTLAGLNPALASDWPGCSSRSLSACRTGSVALYFWRAWLPIGALKCAGLSVLRHANAGPYQNGKQRDGF